MYTTQLCQCSQWLAASSMHTCMPLSASPCRCSKTVDSVHGCVQACLRISKCTQQGLCSHVAELRHGAPLRWQRASQVVAAHVTAARQHTTQSSCQQRKQSAGFDQTTAPCSGCQATEACLFDLLIVLQRSTQLVCSTFELTGSMAAHQVYSQAAEVLEGAVLWGQLPCDLVVIEVPVVGGGGRRQRVSRQLGAPDSSAPSCRARSRAREMCWSSLTVWQAQSGCLP